MDDTWLREQICQGAHQLWQRGMLVGSGGLLTAELHRRRYLATPPGHRRAGLRGESLIFVDLGGEQVAGELAFDERAWLPHRVAYQVGLERERAEVEGPAGRARDGAIHATALCTPVSVMGLLLREGEAGELALTGAAVPVAKGEDEAGIRAALERGAAVAMAGQGLLTVGASLSEALSRAEELEHAAAVELAAGRTRTET